MSINPKPVTKVNFPIPLVVKVSNEMWRKIKDRSKDYYSVSDYIRKLIKTDLNTDDYGKENEQKG